MLLTVTVNNRPATDPILILTVTVDRNWIFLFSPPALAFFFFFKTGLPMQPGLELTV